MLTAGNTLKVGKAIVGAVSIAVMDVASVRDRTERSHPHIAV
jgi:hypothetical protein